jgi:NADH-quinone oxidoreductase subunit I
MYGIGILKGLNVTLQRFISTYVNDLIWTDKRSPETFALRQGTQAEGLFTVEYPDEKIAVPERFRFIPFLVVNNYDDPYAPGHDWCTSCGICAKVCPPQCIWIVRGRNEETGRPVPEPDAFFIDIDICMNCGYCAEYCPFDAIKMDHDYELASYDRTTKHLYDKDHLSKEVRYWQHISPTNAYEEAQVRGQWEHKDTAKLAKKQGIEMTPPEDWDDREKSRHVPNVEKLAGPAPQVAAGAPAAAAAPAAPVSINLDVEGAGPDQLAEWSADEGLPLEARAAAALKLDGMIRNKEFKPSSTHRKAVSAPKKVAKAQDTTIEELAEKFTPGEVVTKAAPAPAQAQAAPAQAAAPAAAPSGPSIDIYDANPDQLAEVATNDSLPLAAQAAAAVRLQTMISNKEFKPTSTHRKAVSAAKKVAKEADTTIEDAAEQFSGGTVVEGTAAPAADPQAEQATVVTPAAPAPTEDAGEASGDDLIAQGRELERKGKAKEIKLTSADRKLIAQAKAAAKDAGIEW